MVTSCILYLSLAVVAAGHGAMTKPVPRTGFQPGPNMDLNHSGCALSPEVRSPDAHARSPCYAHMSWFCGTTASPVPCHTLPTNSTSTIPVDMSSAPEGFDMTIKPGNPASPWRNAGSSIPASPCGKNIYNQDGKDLPTTPREVWNRGATAIVGHSIAANHGGGYSWRVCPDKNGNLDDPETAEKCFQQHPLSFASPAVHVVQWVNGTKVTIPAKQTQTGTTPPQSQWRRNPIPSLEFGRRPDGTCPSGWPQGSDCPAFEPPCAGCWGGVVDSNHGISNSFHEDFSVLDEVVVPDVPAGNYTLQWRWDTESLGYQQVWTNCADITIQDQRAHVLV